MKESKKKKERELESKREKEEASFSEDIIKKKWSFWCFVSLFFKLGVLGFFLLIIFIGSVYIYYSKDLPSSGKIAEKDLAETTKIFDRTGEVLLFEIHGEERRTVVSFDAISHFIKEATVSAEDDDFYTHHGIDFRSIARAVIADLRERSNVQGGSTITQQFIKNSVLTSEKTYTRKIKEAILSLELERRFTKDEILEMYLNEIPYGSNAYGIESASQTFFGKRAKDITLDEATLLAALPKAPSRLSPYGDHTEELIGRRNWIIKRMEDLGKISKEEAEQALKEETLKKVKGFSPGKIEAPHFVMFVKQKLEEEYGKDFVEKGGLRIYTTLDIEMQKKAEEIIKKRVIENKKNFNANNAALVAIQPNTGEVLTMVGSHDYFNKEENGNVNVAIRPNQPGSSFKPFAYATAFAKGYLPETILFDVETNFKNENGQDYIPQNYNGSFRGPVTMKDALANSLNIPAVKTLYLAGINDTIDTAEAMGISTLKDRSRYGLALVLGGGDVTLLEETSAFGVFANDGIKKDYKIILKIENTKGKLIKAEEKSEGKRVLATQVARQINFCLSDNDARAPVFGRHSYLYISGKKIAVKTGTTQEFRDAWTVGYTPEIVTGVWVGNNYNEPMKQGADGSVVAAPIWHDFMSAFIDRFSNLSFFEPEKIKIKKPMVGGYLEGKITLRIDKKSGNLASDDCSKKHTEERDFFRVHSILYYVDKDDPQSSPPIEPKNDPQFEFWEEGVKKWAKSRGISDNPPTEKSCKGKDDDD